MTFVTEKDKQEGREDETTENDGSRRVHSVKGLVHSHLKLVGRQKAAD